MKHLNHKYSKDKHTEAKERGKQHIYTLVGEGRLKNMATGSLGKKCKVEEAKGLKV